MCPGRWQCWRQKKKKNNKVSSQKMLGDEASLCDEQGKKDLFSGIKTKYFVSAFI